jgi:2-polyprenyl-3-methyl-5-hydroxy-6-metoxy-1,4-benzoquinol methylase
MNDNHTRCIICGSESFKRLFSKRSGFGEVFHLVRCRGCGLQSVYPMPSEDEIQKYYRADYFTRRTDRGYDNYFSEKMKREIERIIQLNLKDLNFYEHEKSIAGERRVLDIGCAAGYFVSFMRDRNWHAEGIDISRECVDYAREVMKQRVIQGNYLNVHFKERFHLITLWATIEHLHHPDRVLRKISNDLEDSGMLFLSTCRVGGINFMKFFGKKWRFYNFPEHLFFFSYETIKKLLEQNGLRLLDYITYGSGIGRSGNRLRRAADHLAKRLSIGDMMLISARKERRGS